MNLSNIPGIQNEENSRMTCSIVWNMGFMFSEGFRSSNRFMRYCSKMEKEAQDFLLNVVPGTIANVKESLSSLMHSFFEAVFMSDAKPLEGRPSNSSDWRFNLMPLTHFSAWDLQTADEEVRKGWDKHLTDDAVWNTAFTSAFSEACLQYLHCMYIVRDNVGPDNFCVAAIPTKDCERMLFVKLLMNVMWVGVYCTSVWAQQDRAVVEQMLNTMSGEHEIVVKELERLKSEVVPSYEQKISEMKAEREQVIDSRINDYKSRMMDELRQERRTVRSLEAEIENLKERCRSLEDEIRIMDEADSDESEKRPESSLTHESRIVFIAGAASNGRVERTFERLRQRLPNCKVIHKVEDMNADADCYVFLTRYMVHHSLYNKARDICLGRGYSYIHSSNQNVDLILNDIFSLTKYTDQ